VAVAGVLFWGYIFFGITDLIVPFAGLPEFYDHYLIETGWGLLFTVLVAVPLVVLAVRPELFHASKQIAVVSVAIAIPALLTPALPGHLLTAVGLALTYFAYVGAIRQSSAVARNAPYVERPRRTSAEQVRSWGLVLIGAIGAIAYALDMMAAARSARYPLDKTWDLDHWPMQAAVGLAIVGAAALAALRFPGWRVASWSAAASAVWLGLMSSSYPDHAGSLGRIGGIACAVWGLSLIVESLVPSAEPRGLARSESQSST
jgi:hypothetical protein